MFSLIRRADDDVLSGATSMVSSFPPAQSVLIKGVAFEGVLQAFEDVRGPAFLQSVKEALPKAVHDAVKFGGINSTGWYPIEWYRDLYGTGVTLSKQPDFAKEIGRVSLEREMRGIYRAMLRVLTIEFLVKRGAGLFAQYFQGATATAKITGEKVGEVTFSGCFGFDRNVWLDQEGSLERLLTLAGAKSAESRTTKLDPEHGQALIMCSWT